MQEWTRIPVAVTSEADRRTLCGMLSEYGLEVRIVRVRKTNRGTPRRYIEYRYTGLENPVTELDNE